MTWPANLTTSHTLGRIKAFIRRGGTHCARPHRGRPALPRRVAEEARPAPPAARLRHRHVGGNHAPRRAALPGLARVSTRALGGGGRAREAWARQRHDSLLQGKPGLLGHEVSRKEKWGREREGWLRLTRFTTVSRSARSTWPWRLSRCACFLACGCTRRRRKTFAMTMTCSSR